MSTLSPWIRHRLVSEQEVVEAVLDRHPYRSAEKFVQEVLWRTYWKGWLEMRPTVWTDYRGAVGRWDRDLSGDSGLRSRVAAATEGRTGIECFDCWTRELVEHGYLHNHARMWFASIWIFTLKLPWELGADFSLRFLLDGDPATNTLSWRWVAGHPRKNPSRPTRQHRQVHGQALGGHRRIGNRGAPVAGTAAAVGDAHSLRRSLRPRFTQRLARD